MLDEQIAKAEFEQSLRDFVQGLSDHTQLANGQWTIKGFIDALRNVYTISADTKIVSKILEIHIFPELLKFATQHGYRIVLATHQNYYPDLTFISGVDEGVKFAVDLKTTYRLPDRAGFCNGFTLGSHGAYFTDRTSRKNIQFPYSEYLAHYCLGILYDRTLDTDVDETKVQGLEQLESITSVISNLEFFVVEKWKIASDKAGSGNTANIGSINSIEDVLGGRGMFADLGEAWFDDYWMNYGKITVALPDGTSKKLTDLESFVRYRNGDVTKIVRRTSVRSRGRS